MEKQDALAALAALAQETRLDLFRLLVAAGPEGLSVGEIGDELGTASATLSFHLKELKNAGLIRCDRVGRSRIYSPDFGAAQALVGFLTENCCQGLGSRAEATGSRAEATGSRAEATGSPAARRRRGASRKARS